MSDDVKYCTDCYHHLQCDGYGHQSPNYHKCEYKQNNGLVKRDIISKQFPMVNCKEMRTGECGPSAKLFKAK